MIAKVSFIMHVLAFFWVVCALILILIILLQKGRGGGLSGAFGGGMAGGLLGSKTGDFLTWITVGLVGVFLLLSVALAKFYKPRGITQTDYDTVPQNQQAPVEIPPGDSQPVEVQPVDIEVPTETEVPVETEMPVEIDMENTEDDTN